MRHHCVGQCVERRPGPPCPTWLLQRLYRWKRKCRLSPAPTLDAVDPRPTGQSLSAHRRGSHRTGGQSPSLRRRRAQPDGRARLRTDYPDIAGRSVDRASPASTLREHTIPLPSRRTTPQIAECIRIARLAGEFCGAALACAAATPCRTPRFGTDHPPAVGGYARSVPPAGLNRIGDY